QLGSPAASLTSQGPLQRRGRLESEVAGESRAAAVAGAGSGAISGEVLGAGRGQPLEQESDGRGVGGPALRTRRGGTDVHRQPRGERGLGGVRGAGLPWGADGVLVRAVVAE